MQFSTSRSVGQKLSRLHSSTRKDCSCAINYLKPEFSNGSFGVSDSSERIVVLAKIVIDPDTLDATLFGLDRHLLGDTQAGQDQHQKALHLDQKNLFGISKSIKQFMQVLSVWSISMNSRTLMMLLEQGWESAEKPNFRFNALHV